jgi:hypothetical protein
LPAITLPSAISAFGLATKAKLSNAGASGAPEDQLRAPIEALFRDLATLAGLPEGAVALVGESTLSHLKTRPDYAVTVHNALVGFIEVKAPGKGANPARFTDEHDKRQWGKLRSLPNLIYTDGESFGLFRNGAAEGAVALAGSVETSGDKLAAPATLLPLISDFLRWSPQPPRTAKQLAETAARLCRLLRDEVTEELARANPGLTSLATEWRALLFPAASDGEFADGYAQAVTFGLLVARARGIELKDGIGKAALELRGSNSLIATALRLLTDDPDNQRALKTSIDTLTRVLDVVDWPTLTKGDPDAWLYFYEDFLEVYDNSLRKRTGSYYTPPEVVAAMIRLVDEALRDPALFGRPMGLASKEVTLADPAVGTGAYLLGALRRIAETVEADLGPGAVPSAIAAATERLIGFEMQFGSFAVAQLRLIAEIQTLMSVKAVGTTAVPAAGNLPALRLFVTDTLGDPYAAQTQFSGMVAPIGESRRQANAIKRGEPITVVVGNPPYKEKAKGRGGWIEAGSPGRPAAMGLWSPPVEWGASAHAKHLKNLYVYFWRWATWKVFGSGHADTTGEAETDRAGIVCFITVAGFLNGPGFQKMRDDLRRDCAEIWVIDCSPEGHQPEVATRIFQGVQQPVCIVLAARTHAKDRTVPARLRFRALPEGKREEKFKALADVALDGAGWVEGPSGWREPFLPESGGAWSDFAALDDLFVYNGSGVMPGRTWVIAPDAQSLDARWQRLTQERDPERKETLFHPHEGGDKTSLKAATKGLNGHETRLEAVAKDAKPVIKPVRYAFRTVDRQWIIPDNRLLNRPNPTLWDDFSPKQVFLTAPEDRTPTAGPALSLTGHIPDLHHYNGRGGRAFPLWRDAAATIPNLKPALLAHLSAAYGAAVSAQDLMAYIAGVMAHPAFTARFQADLVRPGLRLPVTGDPALFTDAARLGREVIWLHCYGERFADAGAGRPSAPPRMAKGEGPTIPADGMIPGAPEPLPDTMDYNPALKRLTIGKGFIDNVPKAVWDYEVSGKNVLRQWFSYRKLDRTRPIIGDRRPPSPLDRIQPEHWLDEYTVDLMNLLHVLGRLVALEPGQAELLERICAGPLLTAEALEAAGALVAPPVLKGAGKAKAAAQDDLFGGGGG